MQRPALISYTLLHFIHSMIIKFKQRMELVAHILQGARLDWNSRAVIVVG
jgi:hypothetical protein